jgi:hypothetical protein
LDAGTTLAVQETVTVFSGGRIDTLSGGHLTASRVVVADASGAGTAELEIAAGASVTAEAELYVGQRGHITLDGILRTGQLRIERGAMSGEGKIEGDVTNRGTIFVAEPHRSGIASLAGERESWGGQIVPVVGASAAPYGPHAFGPPVPEPPGFVLLGGALATWIVLVRKRTGQQSATDGQIDCLVRL